MKPSLSTSNPRQAASAEVLRLAITPGEPAGIGADILLNCAQQDVDYQRIAIADPELLEARASLLGLPLRLQAFDPGQPATPSAATEISVLPIALEAACEPGRLNVDNAAYVLKTLDAAVAGCLAGELDALVTGPVQKSIINDAGIPFSGHTEYLQALCQAQPVMMLTSPRMRVALATTHLPLRAVADAITPALLEQIIDILHRDLRAKFGIPEPRIVVAGLNPHAGEGGHLGREDIDIIAPVLARKRDAGMQLSGPLPADTLFTPKHLDQADAVLAMYHDQGLPVLKYDGFGEAVNITLGLPLVRTSVDHGTALDLAGSGKAHSGSLHSALLAARDMSRHFRHSRAGSTDPAIPGSRT